MSGVDDEARARAQADAAVRQTYLGADQIDDLARTLLQLAREVWVLRDRQRVLEAVLEDRGIAVSEAVERYQPGPQLQKQLDAERKAFVQGLMKTLVPAPKA
jgi:hypothetical protein